MDFTLFSLSGALLCGTFFLAGVIDAVCGGGGLLTLPMFSLIHFPAHMIFGTNQCSIIVGSGTSLARFARQKHIHWPTALLTVPFAVIGSQLGAQLNMLVPDAILEALLAVLLPVVAITVLTKRTFGTENHVVELSSGRRYTSAVFIGLGLGMYQGFYGAGAGTFYLLAFAMLMRLDLTTASGNTKVVAFVAVVTASVTYALSGQVNWTAAGAATVFNTIGSYVGAGLAMKRGAKFIRPMFLGVLALLFATLVVRFFG